MELTLEATSTIECKADFPHMRQEILLVDDTLGKSNFVLILKSIIRHHYHKRKLLCVQ
jgi:hypothetical protein